MDLLGPMDVGMGAFLATGGILPPGLTTVLRFHSIFSLAICTFILPLLLCHFWHQRL